MLPYRFTSELDSLSNILSSISVVPEIIDIDDFQFYYIKNNTNFLYMVKITEKNFRLNSKNTFRSDIWWMICKFFPEIKSSGKDILVGWTSYFEIFYHSNNQIITPNEICKIEFSLLLEWTKRVTSTTKREQKAGGLKHDYRAWFAKRGTDISRTNTGFT